MINYVQPSGCSYQSCAELPLYNWIELCVTGDLKWLIKEGTPENLTDTYLNIADEYAELSKDEKAGRVLRLKIQIATLNNKLICIESACNFLSVTRNEEVIDILRNKLGFISLKYDNLDVDLAKTISIAKSDHVRLKKAEKSLSDMLANGGGEIKREDFYTELAVLSKWANRQISPHTHSLMEYIVLKNAFKADNGRESAKNR